MRRPEPAPSCEHYPFAHRGIPAMVGMRVNAVPGTHHGRCPWHPARPPACSGAAAPESSRKSVRCTMGDLSKLMISRPSAGRPELRQTSSDAERLSDAPVAVAAIGSRLVDGAAKAGSAELKQVQRSEPCKIRNLVPYHGHPSSAHMLTRLRGRARGSDGLRAAIRVDSADSGFSKPCTRRSCAL